LRLTSILAALGAVSLVGGLAFAAYAEESRAGTQPAALFPGLGNHHHPIHIHGSLGQKLFDQGMTLLYAFNHDEAIRSFRRAAAVDPEAVMPLWGIAYALGPNINLDVDRERERVAYEATQKALKVAQGAPESERAYVLALAKRYSNDPDADLKKLAADYAEAMRDLSSRYPDDLDAATLYAESLMNLNPWKLWTADGRPAERTEEIVAVLASVLRRDPDHIGANHFYIHAVEASPNPEWALPSAARLAKLVPNAGHLVHMPSHVYMRTGAYEAAARANAEAVKVDAAYIRAYGVQGVYPMMYFNHNLDFLSAAASMAGRYAEAKKASEQAAANIAPAVKHMPMGEYLVPRPVLVDVRFRKWGEVLKAPEPPAGMPTARAVWRYARAVALAAKTDVSAAERESAELNAEAARIPDDALWGLNSTKAVMAVARASLDACLAAARKDSQGAIAAWRTAVDAEDALSYDEPPPWYYPVRESLGAALFLDGQAEEADKVFREDLRRNPRNPRSLFGLWESLKAQKKGVGSEWVRREFQEAWKDADVEIRMEDL
jgi:tetratricopeptide (TPR) repeat protein